VGSDTYYDILGLSPAATPDDIRARYRQLILRIHPDRDGPAALFRQVQEAYEVLSDPVRRDRYDRKLESHGLTARTPSGADPRWHRPSNSASSARRAGASVRRRRGRPVLTSLLSRNPAITLAMSGAILLVFGAALTGIGIALILVGVAALLIAGVAGLGGRGAKERAAYQRSGMTAVDAMTGRQFEILLEHLFANKGYRVARIGSRGEFGADLLLNDARGRIIVQARRRNGVVRHETVQQAVAAMARYGATRGMVVTPSNYSKDAVTVASSNGVTLWNRADLAAELIVFRGKPLQSGVKRLSSELRAGSRICLGFLAAIFVALVAVSTQARKPPTDRPDRR
jgi:curved DNA-binding protein CbpA